jgi:hypothetical protein
VGQAPERERHSDAQAVKRRHGASATPASTRFYNIRLHNYFFYIMFAFLQNSIAPTT